MKPLFYEVTEVIFGNKLPRGTFLNVNLPYQTKELCKGVSIVPLDLEISRYKYVGLNDPNGQIYYWLRDELQQMQQTKLSGDYMKLMEGYVTISPVEFKLHNPKKTQQIQRWFRNTLNHSLNNTEEITHV